MPGQDKFFLSLQADSRQEVRPMYIVLQRNTWRSVNNENNDPKIKQKHPNCDGVIINSYTNLNAHHHVFLD